jgi:hypothetical protein
MADPVGRLIGVMANFSARRTVLVHDWSCALRSADTADVGRQA